MALREARHVHGHGSLMRGSEVALPPVGYSDLLRGVSFTLLRAGGAGWRLVQR